MRQSRINLKVDAVLYFHDCNQRVRYHGDTRLSLISAMAKEFDSSKNCIMICSKYNDLTQKNKVLSDSFLGKFGNQFVDLVHWDIFEVVEDQFLRLGQALKKVQPVIFNYLAQIEEDIKAEAINMWENRKIKKYRKINVNKTKTAVIDVK